MSEVINDRRRMAELYGLLADGRELEILNDNSKWLDSAANDNPKQPISIYIAYRVKPVTYAKALEKAIYGADDKANNTDEMYELIFDSGMEFQKNREDK